MFNDEEHQDGKLKSIKNDNNKTEKHEKKPIITKPQNMVVFIILCLLIIQVLMSGFQTIRDIRQDAQRAQLIANVTKYTASADQLTSQMLTDYKKDVYANANVNSTEKQQVMGTEYNFMAMMLLAKQNNRLLELLSQLR